jgi:plasmid stabilization system protein ParE
MVTLDLSDANPHDTAPEPAAARTRRLADETRQVAEARKSVAVEGVIPLAATRAWADSLNTPLPLPLPRPTTRWGNRILGRSVGLSRQAAEKRARIENWYRQTGAGCAAALRVRAIVAAIECLEFFPFPGGVGDIPGTREFTSQDHRILYELAESTEAGERAADITVLNILGPGEP